ncbi:MAG TPA: hypothetical protein VE264_01825, partial [Nitrososphaera sp.]|nr:hypothetical protein [Nitrososphaera sp.]
LSQMVQAQKLISVLVRLSYLAQYFLCLSSIKIGRRLREVSFCVDIKYILSDEKEERLYMFIASSSNII